MTDTTFPVWRIFVRRNRISGDLETASTRETKGKWTFSAELRELYNRGLTLYKIRRYEQAEETFKQGIAIVPDDEYGRRMLGFG